MTNAPRWAQQQQDDRVTQKAAHLVALLQMRDHIGGIPKMRLARALGISRWTLDRYLASLPEIERHTEQIRQALENEVD